MALINATRNHDTGYDISNADIEGSVMTLKTILTQMIRNMHAPDIDDTAEKSEYPNPRSAPL